MDKKIILTTSLVKLVELYICTYTCVYENLGLLLPSLSNDSLHYFSKVKRQLHLRT